MEDARLVSDVQRLTESLGELPELVAAAIPISASGLRNHYAVDTSRDITQVLDKIVREVIH